MRAGDSFQDRSERPYLAAAKRQLGSRSTGLERWLKTEPAQCPISWPVMTAHRQSEFNRFLPGKSAAAASAFGSPMAASSSRWPIRAMF